MLKRLIRNKFFIELFKNVSYLTIGNIIIQLLNILGLAYIATYLGRENYGIYNTVSAFTSFFIMFTLPQMSKVIIRETIINKKKKIEIYKDTVGLRIGLGLLSSILSAIIGLLMPYSWEIKLLIIIFSSSLFFNSLNTYLFSIYQAIGKMQYLSYVNIIQRLLYLTFAFFGIIFDLGVRFLIISSVISLIISVIINVYLSRYFVKIPWNFKIKFYRKILHPTIIFSILLFLGYISTKIDIIMISFLSTSEDVGVYSLAVQLIQPSLLFRNILFTATFPIFIKFFKKSKLRMKEAIKISMIIGIFILLFVIILFIFSEKIILLIFGKEYADSIPIFSVLIFYLFTSYMRLPFSNILQSTGNERLVLKFAWISPVLNIFLNIFLFNHFGLIGIAYSTLIVGATNFIIGILLSYKVLLKQQLLIR